MPLRITCNGQPMRFPEIDGKPHDPQQTVLNRRLAKATFDDLFVYLPFHAGQMAVQMTKEELSASVWSVMADRVAIHHRYGRHWEAQIGPFHYQIEDLNDPPRLTSPTTDLPHD